MHYRSISDMNQAVLHGLKMIPPDIDLVVGIPRSGLLPANLISLALNLPLADLEGYCQGRILAAGKTRRKAPNPDTDGYRKVLVVDDSISTGNAMQEARDRLAAAGYPTDRFVFCAVYGLEEESALTDVVLEKVPHPRVFEWNFMHHPQLKRSCVDIDGVLCHDPLPEENDDGPLYTMFLGNARPLYMPGFHIGHLVTSRLERYRPQTEAWLAARGIKYDKLWMLDLPTAEERRRRGAHAGFKAQVYANVSADLFIESEDAQAVEIARLSGKPVLSIETQTLVLPDKLLDHAARARRRAARRKEHLSVRQPGWRSFSKEVLRQILPDDLMGRLVQWRRDRWRKARGY
ncbi:MAG: phosphoribosyltransferase family protein [Pseudomonadota bacterium]